MAEVQAVVPHAAAHPTLTVAPTRSNSASKAAAKTSKVTPVMLPQSQDLAMQQPMQIMIGGQLMAVPPGQHFQMQDPAVWVEPPDDTAMTRRVWLEGVTLVFFAVVDNVFSFCTWYYVRYHIVGDNYDRLYNIVQLNLKLFPIPLDTALLVAATLGFVLFIAMVILVECNKLPLFHEIMTIRLLLTALPAGAVCTILVWLCENTALLPFTTVILVLTSIISWCLHMRTRYSHQLRLMNKILLDISWFLSFALGIILVALYCTNSMSFVTKSNEIGCPHTDNVAMPINVPIIKSWHCARWNEKTYISRTPVNDGALTQVACADSFVDVFGISIEPHKIECPKGCLQTFNPSKLSQGGQNVVGCGIYAVDSPICLAAIHAGALTDAGGKTTVYGRLGVPNFRPCSSNSLVSKKRDVTQVGVALNVSTTLVDGSSPFYLPTEAPGSSSSDGDTRRLSSISPPLVLDDKGQKIPQAFHFNLADDPDVPEFIELSRQDLVPSQYERVQKGKPWTRIEATVSMRMAGLELKNAKVLLGEPLESPELFVKANLGQVFERRPSECQMGPTGIVCNRHPSAALHLDFCRPDQHTCPA